MTDTQQNFWHVLARIWAAVAFFHPLIQERGQQWEQALASLLAQAEAVADEPGLSPNQRKVLASLLSTLNDNATRLIAGVEEQIPPTVQPAIVQQTLANNIAYIGVRDWFNFRIAPGYLEEWEYAIRALNEAIEAATSSAATELILDLRETTGDLADQTSEDRFITGRMRSELVARLFTHPVTLPGIARIQHVGYRDPLEAGAALGGYLREWVIEAGNTPVVPAAQAFSGRLVVLTAKETCALLEPVLVLLQGTGRAICIGEQSYAYRAYDQVLPLTDGLSLQLRRYTLMYHDHPARYIPDKQTDDPLAAAVALLSAASLDSIKREASAVPLPSLQPYMEELPSHSQRILAVIKLWTAMRSFYAYRDHLAHWDAALAPAIRQVAQAATREQYFAALQQLSSCCKGGHNFVLFSHDGQFRQAGTPNGFAPPVRLARIDGEITIIGPIEPGAALQPGDILQAINGESVQACERRLRPLFNRFPDEAVDHSLLRALLDSPQNGHSKLQLRSPQGSLREVTLLADRLVDFVTEPIAVTTLPRWGLLSDEFSSIGYLDASRITVADIDQALADLSPAVALIVDIRRYPTLPVDALERFRHVPIPVQSMLRPVVIAPEEEVFGWLENRFYDTATIPPTQSPDLRPLAVLIGPGTISMGEDWAYQLLIGCSAILIGGVTAGGVGSNAFVQLPGGGRASFSGARLTRGALDFDIEGHGIQPHIKVSPVLNEERDIEVIVAADALLQKLRAD